MAQNYEMYGIRNSSAMLWGIAAIFQSQAAGLERELCYCGGRRKFCDPGLILLFRGHEAFA